MNASKFIGVLYFIPLVFCAHESLKQRYCYKLLKFDCYCNQDLVNLTCSVDRTVTPLVYNLSSTLKKTVDRVFFYAEVSLSNKGKTHLLVNRSIDVCKLFDSHYIDPFSNVIFAYLHRVESMPKKCPIEPAHVDILGFYVDDNKYPNVLVEGTVTAKFKIMTKNKQNKDEFMFYIGTKVYFIHKRIKKKCDKS